MGKGESKGDDLELFSSQLNSMIKSNNTIIDKQQKHMLSSKEGKLNKRELELALTVLLVELASCDQSFDMPEYHIISLGLYRMFGTSKDQVTALINQAQTVLQNLRGTSRFAGLLKDNLGEEQRRSILEIIDDLITADGKVDGYETYLRHKLAGLLGVPLTPLKGQ